MFRLDALVILRAKVKQGAKMLVPYRRGPCACAPMWFGVKLNDELRDNQLFRHQYQRMEPL